MSSSSERVAMRTKVGFGIGSIAEAGIVIAFNTWNFLFYNQVLGLSGTLAGVAVTISLVFDGLLEATIGSISDRWRSKLGRRHPFLYAAPIPLALSFFLLYSPPSGLGQVGLFLWFTFFATLHRQALTLYQVPHLALGAELSNDYHQRSVIMSYSSLFAVLGGAGTFFFGWTWFARHDGGSTVRDNYPGLGLGVGLIAAISIFLCAHFTRDQIARLKQPDANLPPFSLKQMWSEILDCLGNRNYKNLLIGYFCLSATLGTLETLQSYVSLFFWQLPEKSIRVFGLASPPAFILAFIITVRLHRKFDKRHTILGSLYLLAFAVAFPISANLLGFFPGPGSKLLVPALMGVTFTFYLAVAILTISVLSALADVADEHELHTGRRQEGVFYAARTFFSKLSMGMGHIIAGLAIDLIRFPTHAKPGEVASDTLVQLGLVHGPLAAVPALVAGYFYGQYAIDRRRHDEIQAALAQRRKPSGGDTTAGQTPGTPTSIEPAPI